MEQVQKIAANHTAPGLAAIAETFRVRARREESYAEEAKTLKERALCNARAAVWRDAAWTLENTTLVGD